MAVPTLHRTPPNHQPMRGASGDARTGTLLMPDEARAIHEMAATVNDMRVTLARMDGKLDAAVTGHADHETRLRALERTRWLMIGAAAAVGGTAGKLIGLL